jgi:hypothetical protein
MTTWPEFEALAELARREPTPTVDVRAKVLSRLRQGVGQRRRFALRDWIVATGLDPVALVWLAMSLVLATAVLGLALPASDTFGQAFVTCMNPLSLVLQ